MRSWSDLNGALVLQFGEDLDSMSVLVFNNGATNCPTLVVSFYFYSNARS